MVNANRRMSAVIFIREELIFYVSLPRSCTNINNTADCNDIKIFAKYEDLNAPVLNVAYAKIPEN